MTFKSTRTIVYVSAWIGFGLFVTDHWQTAVAQDNPGLALISSMAVPLLITAFVMFLGGLFLINRI